MRLTLDRKEQAAVTDEPIAISQRTCFQVAMILAIIADALQLVFLPLFVEGAESPTDDILDLGVGAALFSLLGWHWEFLPSLLCQAGSRSRLSPVLDTGGRKRISKIEADRGQHRRKP